MPHALPGTDWDSVGPGQSLGRFDLRIQRLVTLAVPARGPRPGRGRAGSGRYHHDLGRPQAGQVTVTRVGRGRHGRRPPAGSSKLERHTGGARAPAPGRAGAAAACGPLALAARPGPKPAEGPGSGRAAILGDHGDHADRLPALPAIIDRARATAARAGPRDRGPRALPRQPSRPLRRASDSLTHTVTSHGHGRVTVTVTGGGGGQGAGQATQS